MIITEIKEDLANSVKSISGENVFACYQCGKCTATCPMASEMDYKPNEILHLLQIGSEKVLDAESPWTCATCFNCTAKCPRGINVAAVMDAVRLITLRKGIYKLDLEKIKDIEKIPQIAIVSALRKLTG